MSRQLERTYLSFEKALEQLAAIAYEAVAKAGGLVNMAIGRETGAADFDRTMAVLRRPLDFLAETVAEMPRVAADLAVARTALAKTIALETALAATLAPLRFMQTMFRVESAILPLESREIFESLAQEIGGVAAKVGQSFREQFRALAEVESSLDRAVESMERYSRERGETLEKRQAEIASSLALMAEELSNNARRKTELCRASEDFSAGVNSAIMAMQTQDIVAQRLEHAVRGLGDAVEAHRAAESSPDPGTAGKISTLARIEMAQLDAVAAELKKSETTLRGAIGTVVAHLGGLDEESLLLTEFKHLTVSVDGVVEVMVDSIGALRDMTRETLDTVRRYEQELGPAENALTLLNDSVEQVARSLGRIALNAQIRAVQVGENTGLEVLASHTAELTREALRISGGLNGGFVETSARLNAGLGRLRRLREAGERAAVACATEGAAEEATLHAFRDATLVNVQHLGDLLKQARAVSRSILADCDLGPSIDVVLGVRAAIERLAEFADRLPLPVLVSQAASAESRYTMSGERVVHHRVLCELGAEIAPAPVEAGSNSELF